MTDPTKAKGRVQPAISHTSKNANCDSRALNVRQVDGPVKNCRQHLLILFDPSTVAERFMTDVRIEQARQPALMLGYAHWTGLGRQFATLTNSEGSLVAWCEAPLQQRTARKNCMAATVQHLAEVCATSEVLQ